VFVSIPGSACASVYCYFVLFFLLLYDTVCKFYIGLILSVTLCTGRRRTPLASKAGEELKLDNMSFEYRLELYSIPYSRAENVKQIGKTLLRTPNAPNCAKRKAFER